MFNRDEHFCNCGQRGFYFLQWFGVNQQGQFPIVVAERAVCRDFKHMIEVATETSGIIGGGPERVYRDFDHGEQEYPSLLPLIDEAIYTNDKDRLETICRDGQDALDRMPCEGQLSLIEGL